MPTAKRLEKLKKDIPCEAGGPLEHHLLKAMCARVKVTFACPLGEVMDTLDALFDYYKALAPLLAAAAKTTVTGDCHDDVAAVCAAMDVKYENLEDALVACIGKLGSDFDDAKKRDVCNAIEEKHLARVMKELAKTYRFKKTTPCFKVDPPTKKPTWATKLTPKALEQLQEQEARGEYGKWPTAMDKDESSSDEEEAAAPAPKEEEEEGGEDSDGQE